jgi:hypothetical protein
MARGVRGFPIPAGRCHGRFPQRHQRLRIGPEEVAGGAGHLPHGGCLHRPRRRQRRRRTEQIHAGPPHRLHSGDGRVPRGDRRSSFHPRHPGNQHQSGQNPQEKNLRVHRGRFAQGHSQPELPGLPQDLRLEHRESPHFHRRPLRTLADGGHPRPPADAGHGRVSEAGPHRPAGHQAGGERGNPAGHHRYHRGKTRREHERTEGRESNWKE